MTDTQRPAQNRRISGPGSLYSVLDGAFPGARTIQGYLDVKWLAGELGMSTWGVHKWFHNNQVPAKRVKRLIQLSEGRLTLEMLAPFLI